MNETLRELRRDLATAMRDRDKARKDHDETLRQWTNERATLRAKLRAAQARERMLLKLLADYLAGELDADTVLEKAAR